jgi:hypothetical protein
MKIPEEEFHFKDGFDINKTIKESGESLAAMLGSKTARCMGIRIYYVDEHEVLMQCGLFVKGFSPEEWDEE